MNKSISAKLSLDLVSRLDFIAESKKVTRQHLISEILSNYVLSNTDICEADGLSPHFIKKIQHMIDLYSGCGFFTLKQLFGYDEWVKLPDNRTIGKKFKQAVIDNKFPLVKIGPKKCGNEQQYILNHKEKYKFIDLFAGIGGFHIGLDRAGAHCVFSSEIDKYARMTYKENFYHKNKELFDNGFFNDDITKISDYKKDIPDFDILCGGFPCQPFSQAGFKRGFDEAKENRGNMFNIISNIIEAKRPKAFFLENVRHLLKHDNGKTFDIIRNRLENELNYSFYYKIIKASDYGLPQHRPRIFMVGFRKGSVDLPEFKFPEPQPLTLSMSDVFLGQCNKEIGFTLRVGGRRSGVHDRRNWDGYIVDGETRYLTPIEGKKMQGFPENFLFPVSEVQAMKQLGNSVAINAVEATAREIIKYIDKNVV
ncbi:TPA: DNA (cytosine-5-)-methyltransferase [Photobacterium damselae]|uniref:DNA (cytosine-5-)-methyltransferase n=1 Tax=Photobacterium damselae TaxID=38293 RepID=UPI001CD9B37F|nr:DNA (cytosine-5-)-methyltransferase [Photobacterium damselae]